MFNEKNTIGKLLIFCLFAVSMIFFSSISLSAQVVTNSGIELPEASVENYRLGLKSNNNGVIKSCIYLAGKYQIQDFAQDILDVMKKSEDLELCQMAIWSIYQIGDKACCEKLSIFLESNSSEELRNCCIFLKRIQEYDNAFASALNSNSRD
jgi:hypothetical protein